MGRVLTAATVVVLAVSLAQAGEVQFGLTKDNTKITFVGAKPGKKHDGGFKGVKGSAAINGTDIASLKIAVEIDMNTTWADDDKLTGHLKTADFFDVKNNPTAKFVSSKIEKSGDAYKLTGKLTLNGKTKDLTFPAKITATGDNLTLSSTFKINRHDWGVSYGKGLVEDDVVLTLAVTAKK